MKKTSFFNKLVSFGICYTLLLCTAPVKAGILVGEFSSKVNEHKKFADSFNAKSIGYILFFDKTTGKYSTCSGTLIRSGKDINLKTKKEYIGGWVLTSAHCADKSSKTLGAKFVTEQGEADVDAFIPHFRHDPAIPYAEAIDPKTGQFTCDANKKNKPCSNTSKQAIYDIALVHLTKDLTATTSLEAIPPSQQAQLPEKGFIGGFVGYGRQGSGIPSNPIKVGLLTLFKSGNDPKSEATRINAAIDDRLGGKNFFNVLNSSAGQVLYADLDNGTKLINVDRQPDTKLKLEYSPYFGDSGAGVFDSSNNLVAIVSGAGYGNNVNNLNNQYSYISFAPPNYGSLSFYTPLAQHRGWIAAAIEANRFKTFTKKAYVPTDKNYSPVILTTGGFAAADKSLLPDFMMKIFADVIVEPYPETFNEAVWKEIFPSKPVS
jgi:hypothetical protein